MSDTNRSTAGPFWPSSHRLWNWAVCPPDLPQWSEGTIPSYHTAHCWPLCVEVMQPSPSHTHTHTHTSLPDTQSPHNDQYFNTRLSSSFLRVQRQAGVSPLPPSCQSQRPHLHSGTSCVWGRSNQISKKLRVKRHLMLGSDDTIMGFDYMTPSFSGMTSSLILLSRTVYHSERRTCPNFTTNSTKCSWRWPIRAQSALHL